MRPVCPVCGFTVNFAAAFHAPPDPEHPSDHVWINSHRCSKNDGLVFVACACGDSAWGKDKAEAVAKIGGWIG